MRASEAQFRSLPACQSIVSEAWFRTIVFGAWFQKHGFRSMAEAEFSKQKSTLLNFRIMRFVRHNEIIEVEVSRGRTVLRIGIIHSGMNLMWV